MTREECLSEQLAWARRVVVALYKMHRDDKWLGASLLALIFAMKDNHPLRRRELLKK
jgi:hypothetical protein